MKPIFLLFIISLLCSCSTSESKPVIVENSETEKLIATTEALDLDNCQGESANCAIVKLNWLIYKEGSGTKNINKTIIDKFINELQNFSGKDSTSSLDNFEALANSFLLENNRFKADFPSSNASWFIEMQCKEIYQSTQYLSVEFSFSAYTGGAHGSDNIYFAVFDPTSGSILNIEDVVSDLSNLRQIAELKFRELKEIKEEITLSEAGYFIENESFPVEGNFAIVNDSLLLMYNPYDIASYSEGRTLIKIGLNELHREAL